jgi:hypothetical protein
MNRPRCIGRLAAAGTGVLAASALALAAAPSAGAQEWIPSPDVDVSAFVWERTPVPKILNPCDLPSRPCDLAHEKPRLFPDPNPERFIVPVSQFQLTASSFRSCRAPGSLSAGSPRRRP